MSAFSEAVVTICPHPMWFIALFSICAAFSFRREIARRGYDAPKAVRFPVLLGIATILVQQLLGYLLATALKQSGINPRIVEPLLYLADFFVIALFIGAIAKNWFAIKRLPPRSPRPPAPDA
jgi:hypothetical protein